MKAPVIVFTARQKEKVRAQLALAVRTGKLIKPTICEWCDTDGTQWDRGLTAHHEDYSKALEVIWLCSGCHAQRHIDINLGQPVEYSRNRMAGLRRSPRPNTWSAWRKTESYRKFAAECLNQPIAA